jgi:hypothetical protein
MKRIALWSAVFLLGLFVGCATTDEVLLDTTHRFPSSMVDVYKDGRSPERPFKEIAELSFLGPREEELTAQKFFVERARKMGGDGILFTIVPAGQKGGGAFGASGGAWGVSTAWVFKGKVIIYE